MALSPVSNERKAKQSTPRTGSPVLDFVRVYFEHARVVNLIVLAFVAAGVAGAFLLPPGYALNAQVIVMNKRIGAPVNTGLALSEPDRYAPPTMQDIETENNIIRSRRVIGKATEQLIAAGVIEGPDGVSWDALPSEERNIAVEGLIAYLTKELEVVAFPGSNIINLNLVWGSGEAGATIVNTIVQTYLDERVQLTRNDSILSVLEKNLEIFHAKIVDLQDQRAKLLASKGIARVEGSREISAASLRDETQQIRLLETRITQIESHIKQLGQTVYRLKNADPTDAVFSPLPMQDEVLQEAEKNVNDAFNAYQATISTYNVSSAPARNAFESYLGVRSSYIDLVQSRIPQLRLEKAGLEAELIDRRVYLARLEGETSDVESITGQIERLDIELLAAQEAYKSFSARRDAAVASEASATLQLSNVQILQQAIVPAEPAAPNKPLLIILGTLAGLFFAALFVCVDRLLTAKFRTPDDVTRELELPVFGYTLK